MICTHCFRGGISSIRSQHSFPRQKKKDIFAHILSFVGFILIISPVIPFVLNVINVPDYLMQYSLPFNYEHVIVYLTNMFSPKLTLNTSFDFSSK